MGFGIADWTFWQWPGPARKLAAGVTQDTVSVMNVGLILGALLGAALAGRFAARRRLTAGQVASAVIGGLLLGYGARLAFGCNIGAFFSGVASGSVHGWLWLLAALPGAALGARLRPLFGLDHAAAPAAEGNRA